MPLVASLLLVAMPGALSSVLVTGRKALVTGRDPTHPKRCFWAFRGLEALWLGSGHPRTRAGGETSNSTSESVSG